MPEITFAVTKAVLGYVKDSRPKERQIAYSKASSDIAPALSQVTTDRPLKLRIAGQITLVVADRGAIWYAHNTDHVEEFDGLFAFLARFPDRPFRFLCEIVR